MDRRNPISDDRLPGASEAFTQAIFDGADAIRRYERKRLRRRAFALAAAALMLVCAGLGAALVTLNAPRPDTVVAARPSLTTAPTDAPAPEAEEAPEDDGNALASADTGLTALTDDGRALEFSPTGLVVLTDTGPFVPGEWVVLTKDDGGLDYGLHVPFFEQASADARAVGTVVGMQVKYLGDAEDGFAKVQLAGIDGYVYASCLRRPPVAAAWDPNDGLAVAEATLYITNSSGKVVTQLIEDSDHALSCYALRKLLDTATPADGAYPDAPMGALLVVCMRNPDTVEYRESGVEKYDRVVRFALPCDGTPVLQAEGGGRYTVSEPDWRLFWDIFVQLEAEKWEP